MSDIKITELKEFLATKSDVELRTEIVHIFKLFPQVKEYYTVKINPEAEKEILEKYKKIITDEFFPDRGFGKLRYSVIKSALNSFRKLSNNPEHIAELMISQVEYGVMFINEYGDIDEKFYDNIMGMYEKLLKFIFEQNIQLAFTDRLRKIVVDGDGIGWGFSDELAALYDSYFDE